MARSRFKEPDQERVISIVGPGMTVVGDCKSTGSIRVEGVVEGTIQSDKSVVVGKGACVNGDVTSRDGVVAGTVNGVVRIEARLEFHATGIVDGEVHAGLLQLEEGGKINGAIKIGRIESPPASQTGGPAAGSAVPGRREAGGERPSAPHKRARAAATG